MKRILLYIVFLLVPWWTAASAHTAEQRQRFVYYFYEAERLWQNEQYPEAFNLFEFCHDLNPNDPITNRYLGHIYEGCKLTDQALDFYRQAWEQAPTECWADYAITLFNRGHEKDQQAAIHIMEQTAQQMAKPDINLWDRLREAYTAVHRYKDALSAQDQLDQIEGYNAYSAINRYNIYRLMRDAKHAIQAIEDYLKEEPTNIQFQMYRMQLYEATGQPAKKIIQVYQDILALDPTNAVVLNNYAYLLTSQKGSDLKLAEQMSLRAIQIESQNPTYLDTYAWILYLLGNQELANLYIRQAIRLYEGQDMPREVLQHYQIITGK